MQLRTYPSNQIQDVRDLAKRFNPQAIDQCMQLALEEKANPCYSANEIEDVMNVLAKASFVSGYMQKGHSMSEAIRELGKRIRSLQGNNNDG